MLCYVMLCYVMLYIVMCFAKILAWVKWLKFEIKNSLGLLWVAMSPNIAQCRGMLHHVTQCNVILVHVQIWLPLNVTLHMNCYGEYIRTV